MTTPIVNTGQRAGARSEQGKPPASNLGGENPAGRTHNRLLQGRDVPPRWWRWNAGMLAIS